MPFSSRSHTSFLDASPLAAMTGTAAAANLSAEQVSAMLEELSPRAASDAALRHRNFSRLLRVLLPAIVVIVWLAASLAAPA